MSLLLEALKKAAEENVETVQEASSKRAELPSLHTPLLDDLAVEGEEELQDIVLLPDEEPLDFSEDLVEMDLDLDDSVELAQEQPVAPDAENQEPHYGSNAHAQQIFASKQEQKKNHAFWLLLLLILLLLLGIIWWAYEFFMPPAPVARVGQFEIVAPLPVEPSVAPPAVKLQPVAVEKATAQPKPRPAPVRAKKKISIVRSVKRDTLLENLQLGFAEYQQGNYSASRIAYSRALQEDAKNRDALLGLAANSMRQAQTDEAYLPQAKRLYIDLLELNPQDAAARAGLAAADKRFSNSNSLASLKEAIQQRPQLAPLHYSLANKYAGQRSWGQAQAAYFKAFTLAPDNADYAFNLAVSLDKIGQSSTALKYYQQASDLALHSPHAIDLRVLRKRMQHLQEAD